MVDDTFSRDRMGTPADIAKAVVFLAPEEADWVTGQFIMVSGM
jgi:NAD(P)-dependent dehydrogenase (short-subunit alcohol dehydrogenase family)